MVKAMEKEIIKSYQDFLERTRLGKFPSRLENTTIPLDNLRCPTCQFSGQAKLRRRGKSFYLYVDHYGRLRQRNGNHGKYRRSCYIGKIE